MTQTGEFERHNLEVDREMEVGRNCRTIEVYFETWFDVVKKFNLPAEVNDEDGTYLMRRMMEQPLNGRSVEYADNRISLFSAQWGKCAVTGIEFITLDSIHCHHIVPRSKGGTDKYHNLVLILPTVHTLIHATQAQTIEQYLKVLNLNEKQLAKVNEYREKAGNAKI